MRKKIATSIANTWGAAAPVLNALGSTTRQQILLLFEPKEQINIKTVAEQFNLSRTAVVHHINVLQDAGLLKGERIGKEVIMYVDWEEINKHLSQVNTLVENNCGN